MNLADGPAQYILPPEELAAIPNNCRPRALGPVPRLGLGSRATVLSWPAVFGFLSQTGLFANAIQNSVARELMPLAMLDDPGMRPTTLQPGLGPVSVGHTGSTIEGLLHWGMRSAAQTGYAGPGYGADADHLPVYRPESAIWDRTVRLIRYAREYTHFTLDIGAIMAWEQGPLTRLAPAPPAIAAAVEQIRKIRDDAAFDLEISLDESPESIAPDAASTRPEEMIWLLEQLAGLGVAPAYLAPHLGFTKGSDVADLQRLAEVAEGLHRAASEYNALLSIHSGDDLSSATRRVLGEASGGRLLFKVAPALQKLFVHAVLTCDPALADRLTTWTVQYAAERGTPLPPADAVYKFAFAAFGDRDAVGQFEMRERLYNAGDTVKTAFADALTSYLAALADDLFGNVMNGA